MMRVFLSPTACPHYLDEAKPLLWGLTLVLTCSLPYGKTDRCLMYQVDHPRVRR